MIIQVNSLPVLEVIKDFSRQFNTEYTVDVCEYTVDIPNEIGSGTIKAYHLDNGMGMLEYNCIFYIDIEIKFIVNDVHPLKFIFITKGNLEHLFENKNEKHLIEQYQSAIVASSEKFGHILKFKANTSVSKFSVEINRDIFNLNIAFNSPKVHNELYKLFSDVDAKDSFYYKGDYSLTIADVLNNLKTYNDFEGDRLVYKIYMESIAYQTLVFHLSQYLDDQNGKKTQQILRKKEFEQLKEGVEYIITNLDNYGGIDELSKATGLNPIKLQKGFKHLFNATINQYVQERRLEKARELLLHSDLSINEIVSSIGLKSASYFSRIFREKYGVMPSQFNKSV